MEHVKRNNKGRIAHPGWPGRHTVSAECLNYTDRVKKNKKNKTHRVGQTSYQSEDYLSVGFSQKSFTKTFNFLFHLCTFSSWFSGILSYSMTLPLTHTLTHTSTHKQWRPWGRERKGKGEVRNPGQALIVTLRTLKTFDQQPELLFTSSLFLMKRVRKLFETYVCSLRVSGNLLTNRESKLIFLSDWLFAWYEKCWTSRKIWFWLETLTYWF